MRSIRTSGLTALASALALAVTAIPVSLFASGPAAVAPTTIVQAANPGANSAGTLSLSTTSSRGTVTWNGQVQEFTGGTKCAIQQLPGGASLLDLVGYMGNAPGTAGFRDGKIGVYEFDPMGKGPKNAAQCFRVDAGSFAATETLGLHLGADAVDDFGDPLTATKATVSLMAQSRDGTILVTLVGAPGTADKTLPLLTWKNLKAGNTIKVNPFNISAFPGDYVGLRLKANKGSFSLRGATFDLQYAYDGVLGCDASTMPIAAEGTDPGVVITRLDNADPAEPCVLIPYRLRTGDQEVQFLKPLDEQLSAQFILDFVWTVSPANTDWGSPASLLPETTIDYEQGGGEIPLRWCPDVTTDGGGNPTGIDDVLTNGAAVDQEPALDGKQFTCIITQDSTVVDGDPDYVTVEQKVYLLGDAAYRFR